MDENVLKQLFQWPADRPLRKPRFGGSAPPEPIELPPASQEFGDKDRPPFYLELALENLGLIVTVEEDVGQRAGELWAKVRSVDVGHVGKEVRVGLIGTEERMKRVAVPISSKTQNGSFGEIRIGSIDEVRTELGEQITLSAFLLE